MNDRYNEFYEKSVMIFDLDIHFKVKLRPKTEKNIAKWLKTYSLEQLVPYNL
jgi:hypothetical protein